MKTLTIDQFEFEIANDVLFAVYQNESYSGAVFTLKNGDVYDICNNYHMGPRLLIKAAGKHSDIPFKETSYSCLPKQIKVKVKNAKL